MEDRNLPDDRIERTNGRDVRRRAQVFLWSCLGLGILADYLLRAEWWGANFTVGVGLFLCLLAWLHYSGRQPLVPGGMLALGGGFIIALCFLWRASPGLQALNTLFFLGLLLFMVTMPAGRSLRAILPGDVAYTGLVLGLQTLAGPLYLLAGDLRENDPGKRSARLGLRLLGGGLLAVPPLLLFGSLFMSADPLFDHAVRSVFDIRFDLIFSHAIPAAFLTWIIGGFLRGRFLVTSVPPLLQGRSGSFQLGLPQAGVVLASLNLLFAAFVIFQFRYLFGGASVVESVPGLTYAEYARKGFFELAAVGAFVVPLLLAADWVFQPGSLRERRVFQILTLLLVGLLFAILASALQRMLLYQQEYGLTEPRVYVTAAIVWLTLLLLWYLGSVLRGRRELFVPGGVAAAFLVILTLNWINPCDVIARTNLARAREGKKFDLLYHANLGADAVPALLQGIPALNAADRQQLLREMLIRHRSREEAGWRAWTIARSIAAHELDGAARELDSAPGALLGPDDGTGRDTGPRISGTP